MTAAYFAASLSFALLPAVWFLEVRRSATLSPVWAVVASLLALSGGRLGSRLVERGAEQLWRWAARDETGSLARSNLAGQARCRIARTQQFVRFLRSSALIGAVSLMLLSIH
jgi:hypothetical protein